MQLHIFHNTAIKVSYVPDSQESFTAVAGQTYVDHREIRVTFYGPVQLGNTGILYERSSIITVQRTNGVMRWHAQLGTPLDGAVYYENDVPGRDIPEAVAEAVDHFIQIFEKGKS